ncbi:MAG TPA: 4-alpha-glucanotransferase [Gammaproteobacteria bacterium]|nr:4-alpha-glucanotransferase [Gammaproteobacteria bacterium]
MNLFAERRAGVLLHPTSLPGKGPRGTFGADARHFVDWLVAGAFSVWQTLPLGVTDAHGSPYALRSAHAGDPRFIDAEDLAAVAELPAGIDAAGDREARYASFTALATAEQQRAFAQFTRAHRRWLEPYALFEHLSRRFEQAPWWEWPTPYRDRDAAALRECRAASRVPLRALVFEQYLFELQWSALKRYANQRGVYLFGDLPFYVDRNNVDVWWERHLFAVDASGHPLAVAGVPPDYFNADGQLWGNPLYDWGAMQRSGFRWWLERIGTQLARFDLLRIDHFRALESYWAIPAEAPSARLGEWQPCPGDALLTALRAEMGGEIPLVAEDLGIITDEVRALRDRFGIPGMAVLQFAFDGSPDNPYLPEHHRRNSVVYTGTHDNDTTVGWYASLDSRAREIVHETLGVGPAPPVPDFLIDAAYASRAALAIIPMQDLLARDSGARMNTPGTVVGNWRWRFEWADVPSSVAAVSLDRAVRSGRAPRGAAQR